MRETIRSLRVYFVLSGLASLWLGCADIAQELHAGISFETGLAIVIGMVGIGLALAFLYVGIALSRLLRNSSQRIILLLYLSAGWAMLISFLSFLNGVQGENVAFLVISLVILWYLLRNIRRLAAEAQNSSPSVAM